MPPVRVLIVDDSAVVRGLLVHALGSDPQIHVVATAMHGDAALRTLRREPVDVVILDVEMPVMDGLTALPHILSEFPEVRVIMASAATTEGAETTIHALALGAAECIAKPVAGSTSASVAQLVQHLVPLVKSLGRAVEAIPKTRVENQSANGNVRTSAPNLLRGRTSPGVTPTVLVVGASTGGPNALSNLLKEIPTDFALPILIVQHMPALFTPMLAKHLERDGGRPCREAVDGGAIQPGNTYVAPGDFHMLIEKRGDRMVTLLNQAAPEHYCRPSVNPLFRSAAEWYGRGVLAVMLTGMGDDGIEGVREVVSRGGRVIAQDEATSVVWGMPGAVVRERLADEVLPLGGIAEGILRACGMTLIGAGAGRGGIDP